MSLLDFSTTRSFPSEVDSTVDNDQGTLSLVKASGGGGGGGGGKTDVRSCLQFTYHKTFVIPLPIRCQIDDPHLHCVAEPSFSSFGRRYMPLFPLRPGVSDQFIGGKA
ncbi:hypothetical protein Bca101_087735 [Brassica carinata]